MKALGILDRELAARAFVAGDAYTIADISLFAYASRAREAELPLDDFGNVVAWIARVEAQPGFLAEVYPYSIDPHSSRELP
jgi:glutathione S-transferase